MKIGTYDLTVKGDTLTISPTNLQIPLKQAKEMLGIDKHYAFQSMFESIDYDGLLNKTVYDIFVKYEYVITKKDMVKIQFYDTMTYKAWVNGEIFSKGDFTQVQIVDIIDNALAEYEKTKKIVIPDVVSQANIITIPDSALNFYPKKMEMSRDLNPDGFFVVTYRSKLLENTKMWFTFGNEVVMIQTNINGTEVKFDFSDAPEIPLQDMKEEVKVFINLVGIAIKAIPPPAKPNFINYKNKEEFDLQDWKNAGILQAVSYISNVEIYVTTKEANGITGVIKGFTNSDPSLRISFYDKSDLQLSLDTIHPNILSGYSFEYLAKKYNEYANKAAGGDYTTEELKNSNRTDADKITYDYIASLCTKYSKPGIMLHCINKFTSFNVISNISRMPVIINKNKMTGVVDVSVGHGIHSDNTYSGIEETIKNYSKYMVDLKSKSGNQNLGDMLLLDVDSISHWKRQIFKYARGGGLFTTTGDFQRFAENYLGSMHNTIDLNDVSVLDKRKFNDKPKYKYGDYVHVKSDGTAKLYASGKYNIESNLKTAGYKCMIENSTFGWNGIIYSIRFPNTYVSSKEWKMIDESSMLGLVKSNGKVGKEVSFITEDMTTDNKEKELGKVLGDVIPSLTGSWGGKSKQRAADVTNSIAETQAMLNKEYPELMKTVFKDNIFKNVQILNVKTVPGKPGALACVTNPGVGNEVGTTMCLPTKTLSIETPINVVTGGFTVRGTMNNYDSYGTKTISDIYIHELGHIIHIGIRNKKVLNLIHDEFLAYRQKFSYWGKGSSPKGSGYISKYSFEDDLEFFAEGYVVYIMGKDEVRNVIPKGMMAIYDHVSKAKEI